MKIVPQIGLSKFGIQHKHKSGSHLEYLKISSKEAQINMLKLLTDQKFSQSAIIIQSHWKGYRQRQSYRAELSRLDQIRTKSRMNLLFDELTLMIQERTQKIEEESSQDIEMAKKELFILDNDIDLDEGYESEKAQSKKSSIASNIIINIEHENNVEQINSSNSEKSASDSVSERKRRYTALY